MISLKESLIPKQIKRWTEMIEKLQNFFSLVPLCQKGSNFLSSSPCSSQSTSGSCNMKRLIFFLIPSILRKSRVQSYKASHRSNSLATFVFFPLFSCVLQTCLSLGNDRLYNMSRAGKIGGPFKLERVLAAVPTHWRNSPRETKNKISFHEKMFSLQVIRSSADGIGKDFEWRLAAHPLVGKDSIQLIVIISWNV